MAWVRLQFDHALDLFTRRAIGGLTVAYGPERRASIKDMIEASGVPHTEVGRMRSSEGEIGFDCIPEAGQIIEVEPIQPPFDVIQPSFLRPDPLEQLRFITDTNVARLGAYLRFIGLDAAVSIGMDDDEIAAMAEREGRIVLSKDIGLLKRKRIVFGRYVRNVFPEDQFREMLSFFGIRGPFALLSRCLKCNSLLEPVVKDTILHRIEPKTKEYYHEFKICRQCDQIFWKGSHVDGMLKRLEGFGINCREHGGPCP